MLIKAKRNIHTAVDLPGKGLFHIDKNQVKEVDSTLGRLLISKWPHVFEEVLTTKKPYISTVKETLKFTTTSGLDIDDFKFA